MQPQLIFLATAAAAAEVAAGAAAVRLKCLLWKERMGGATQRPGNTGGMEGGAGHDRLLPPWMPEYVLIKKKKKNQSLAVELFITSE